MYSDIGRPSIPPEQLLRALLLQALYTVRSERLLMEEIDYSVLFRWFVGLGMDEPIWSPTTFSKNRDRLLKGDIASAFFDAVLRQAREAGLLSDEHFTVDGTLLEAWASLKSFQRKDAGPTPPPDDPGQSDGQFSRGDAAERHACVDDRSRCAALSRRARARRRSCRTCGHVLLDNRHGLVANVCVTAATGTAEREAALLLLDDASRARRRSAGDKGYRRRALRRRRARRWGSRRTSRRRSGAARSTAGRRGSPGYAISQRKRKLIEQVFGWMKTVGGLRKLRHRGGELVDWIVTFTAAAYNLIRLRTLLARA